MKAFTLLFSLFVATATVQAAADKTTTLSSPDGTLKVTATTGSNGMTWAIEQDGNTVLLPSAIDITIDGKHSIKAVGKEAARKSVDKTSTEFYVKKSALRENYNTVTLKFPAGISVEFRAYNDFASYRILTQSGKKQRIVNNEKAVFRFADDYKAFVPYVNDNRGGERWCYSFESYYDEHTLSQMHADSLAIVPLAVCLPQGKKAIVLDAGVENYPGMMLVKGDGNSLKAEFAPYPIQQQIGGYARLNLVPTNRAEYIARITGSQALPWRAVVVSRSDKDIMNCDVAQLLAPQCRIGDTEWIKPGKVAWDWWNNTNITGVDFKSGMNTPTYKYYIDFASKNKLEYIIIDEGWSTDESLTEGLNPEINIPELIEYGKQRGVGIILWSSWRNLIGSNPDGDIAQTDAIMQRYADMGIKGFKVDFFDRDDQQVIASAYKIAESAARHRLLLDYHGLKPAGINRAYPNILNFEGVKGLENSKWEPRVGDGPLHNQPRYDVSIPYLRMLTGPMDYTPGAMMNAHRDNFFGNNDHPMSQGTRVHQLAMYATFEAPLQMLADSPTKYEHEQECTDFIAQIPTVYDETIALDGKLGEYSLLARRKGDTWFIAALTDWTPRSLTLDLSFLTEGSHEAIVFADGANAEKEATDYKKTTQRVRKGDKLTIRLAKGGGWAAIMK
ncbi:MAG: glycoside hydrolase family 97 protein [Prevotella sp.]